MNNLHMSNTSIKKARAARDAGMARALDHAERACEWWRADAEQGLISFARETKMFTSFDFRQRMRDEGRQMPPTDKAFGPLFLRAANRGLIEKVGYAQHPERHCSPTPVWLSRIYSEGKGISITIIRQSADEMPEKSSLPYDICLCLGEYGRCPRIATCLRATSPAGPRSTWMARVCEPGEFDAYIGTEARS